MRHDPTRFSMLFHETRFALMVLVMISIPFATTHRIHADLIGVNNTSGGTEYGSLDLTTGAFDVLYTGPLYVLRGVAYEPASGLYYGVDSDRLIAVDIESQQTQLVGTTGFTLASGLTYHAVRDELYATTSFNQLIRIDRTTGQGTLVGSTVYPLLNIAYNPFDNQMYGTYTGLPADPGLLFTVNPDTAEVTLVSEIDRGIIGLAIDPDTGVFYASDGFTQALYTLDPLTGQRTLVGPTPNISGLTFGVAPVPEPSSMLIVLLGLVFARRRTRSNR